jgi:hypothetical protein
VDKLTKTVDEAKEREVVIFVCGMVVHEQDFEIEIRCIVLIIVLHEWLNCKELTSLQSPATLMLHDPTCGHACGGR